MSLPLLAFVRLLRGNIRRFHRDHGRRYHRLPVVSHLAANQNAVPCLQVRQLKRSSILQIFFPWLYTQ